jgi:Cu(I)/Ag(I) efflux system membrane protein CusA/SilA
MKPQQAVAWLRNPSGGFDVLLGLHRVENLAYNERRAKGLMRNMADLKEAIEEGAVKRLRPKVMTVGVMFMGLVPIMWSTGAGSDVMRRIVAPMIGGIFTSFILELVVYPAIYEIWRGFEVRRLEKGEA